MGAWAEFWMLEGLWSGNELRNQEKSEGKITWAKDFRIDGR